MRGPHFPSAYVYIVQNDLIAFILAGHDTTANALSSAFYYLAKDKVYDL